MDEQRKTCLRFGADYLPCEDHLKVGIGKHFNRREFPIHGLRHSPEGDTTGWYIWSGEYSEDPNFFVALHSIHLREGRCPEIVKYLGMAPGWRFLVAPGWEDVWY